VPTRSCDGCSCVRGASSPCWTTKHFTRILQAHHQNHEDYPLCHLLVGCARHGRFSRIPRDACSTRIFMRPVLVCVCRSDPRLHDSRCRHGHGHWKEDALRLATVASEMDRKEWRPTCISAVSTQLTKCCGIGELPNLLTQPTPSHHPSSPGLHPHPASQSWTSAPFVPAPSTSSSLGCQSGE
jgi:hypothetical protein